MKNMERNLNILGRNNYDLIVIGGGIFGICCAWDAVQRGLSVALIERRDFSGATSANNFKIIHCGIRYLQHLDVSRIRESSNERSILLKIAPHLVRNVPIVIPTYGHGKKGKEVLRAGLILYDLLTLDRNKGIVDQSKKVKRSKFMSRKDVLRSFPDLEADGLTGGAIFEEGQMYNPPRLALSFLRAAKDAGLKAINYVEVTRLLMKENQVFGVKVRDLFSGEEAELKSKIVLNTVGPWANSLLQRSISLKIKPEPVFSRDLAFVTRIQLSKEFGIACQIKSKDADAIFERGGRHILIVPWRKYSLIGVWHMVYTGEPDEIKVTDKELQFYISEINTAYPDLNLKLEDITMVNTGLTLFGENTGNEVNISFGKRSILIDHSKENSVDGLVTLIGVRATIARRMAVKAIDLVFKKIGKEPPESKTKTTPVYGGDIDNFEDMLNNVIKHRPFGLSSEILRTLIHNYGSRYKDVLKYIKENPEWVEIIDNNSNITKAEIIHAVREEMAQKLGDVVFRRTELGTAENPGGEALRTCAKLMAYELKWDNNRKQKEIEEVKSIFLRKGSIKNYKVN
jgi:glycerol-3-phosphate dehydrogenase